MAEYCIVYSIRIRATPIESGFTQKGFSESEWHGSALLLIALLWSTCAEPCRSLRSDAVSSSDMPINCLRSFRWCSRVQHSARYMARIRRRTAPAPDQTGNLKHRFARLHNNMAQTFPDQVTIDRQEEPT